MARHKQHNPPGRVYAGGLHAGAGELLREAEWASLPPTRVSVRRPDDNGRERTVVAYVQLRCKCRVRRDWGFNRCNCHISSVDRYMGHKYCIQCRQTPATITATAVVEAIALRRNYERATGRQMPRATHGEDVLRCVQEAHSIDSLRHLIQLVDDEAHILQVR